MSDKFSIRPEQARAARALLGWSRAELAKKSEVSAATLADFEAGKRQPYDRTLVDVRAALEAGGVVFIPALGNGPANAEGPGVRLRKNVGEA
jgi:transcriptional regulator with XRE-family HTH domain